MDQSEKLRRRMRAANSLPEGVPEVLDYSTQNTDYSKRPLNIEGELSPLDKLKEPMKEIERRSSQALGESRSYADRRIF